MPTDKKRIQAYVSLSIYESLKDQAKSRNMSISELVSEILQTQSATVSSSTTSSADNSFVTRDELSSILQKFSLEIERKIIREVNIAETRWEANATAITSLNTSLIKGLERFKSSPESKKQKG